MMIVDAHQDLAWNILSFGRDYTRSALDTRRLEANSQTPQHNGDTLLGWPEYQQGRVSVIFSTLFASPARRTMGEWDSQSYATTPEAQRRYSVQLDAYHRLTETHPDKFRLIQTQADLRVHLSEWQLETATPAVGLVILMEGAEAVGNPTELEEWWRRGVRIIGPAWAGTRFCGGTGEPGPLTSEGFALLEAMADFGFSLDLSHMDEKAALQALDVYPGSILASHANAAALLEGLDSNRFLSERVVQGLIERDAIIGVVPFNRFLLPGWKVSDGRHWVTLDMVVAQIDHICQIAGDAFHAGIGSDFDGGFGVQSTPEGIDTVADLQKIATILEDKGYTELDIQAVLGQNWLKFLGRSLP